jgi:hypothetical protein
MGKYKTQEKNMLRKKNLALTALLVLAMAFTFVGCGKTTNPANLDATDQTQTQTNQEANTTTAAGADYVKKFASLGTSETLESMNEKFGVEGVLSNPEVSSVSYVWKINDETKIEGSLNSGKNISTVTLKAPNKDLYNPNVKFADDLESLKGKEGLTYEDFKAKAGGVDGIPTYMTSTGGRTYVWASKDYKLTVNIGTGGTVTTFTGIPISL